MTKPKRDWREFFQSSDFNKRPWAFEKHLDCDTDHIWEGVRDIANALIREALREELLVFGSNECGVCSNVKDEDEALTGPDTHTAKLVDVRGIEK